MRKRKITTIFDPKPESKVDRLPFVSQNQLEAEKHRTKRREKLHRRAERKALQRKLLGLPPRARVSKKIRRRIQKQKWKLPEEKKKKVRDDTWFTAHSLFLKSPGWRSFRWEIIKERKSCQKCGSMNKLHVHHKHYRTYHHERPQDVLLLCESCHDRLHKEHKEIKIMSLENYSNDFLMKTYVDT
jgi:hypothetical protein